MIRTTILFLIMITVSSVVSYGKTNIQERIDKANNGDAFSQEILVEHYYDNDEYQNCKEWALKLLDNVNCSNGYKSTANLYLGLLYANGKGVLKSNETAIGYFKDGVILGSYKCANYLAQIYELNPQSRDLDKAFYWFKESAKLGYYEAAFLVATQYENNSGESFYTEVSYPKVEINFPESIKYYELYIENLPSYKPNPEHEYQRKKRHDPEIEYKIANAYFYGENGVEQNYEKAVKYYETFINGNGDTISYMKRGVTMPDPKEGESLWNLSTCYRFGRGVVKNELTARKLIRKAAEKGNEKAVNFLNKDN